MGKPLQSRFPKTWLIAQYLLCGVFYRKRYVVQHLPPNAKVMEVGCSLGLDSINFVTNTQEFLGVDIDPDAIAIAKKRFSKHPHMRFACQDVRSLNGMEEYFDFILFCGSCHHIPDEDLISILRSTATYLTKLGKMVIIDYATNNTPSLLDRLILHLEEGKHVRTTHELTSVIESIGTLSLVSLEEFDNPAFIFPWPRMAKKLSIVLKRTK